jgi:hypothetical protein
MDSDGISGSIRSRHLQLTETFGPQQTTLVGLRSEVFELSAILQICPKVLKSTALM